MKKIIQAGLGIILICGMVFKLPQMHYSYIRNYVGSKVVTITTPDGSSGGTGFHIQAPSGKTYIMTNSHVCNHVQIDGHVQVFDNAGNSIPRRVLFDANFTDLCLVEAMPGISGLSIGSKPEAGDIVAVVGHPKLMPTTMSRGEIMAEETLQILDHVIKSEDDKCDLPKNKKAKINIFVFEIEVCLIEIKAYLSNVTILPGNSGSPVINFFGNVVGVVFAGDSDSNWGSFVRIEDVHKVLKPF